MKENKLNLNHENGYVIMARAPSCNDKQVQVDKAINVCVDRGNSDFLTHGDDISSVLEIEQEI